MKIRIKIVLITSLVGVLILIFAAVIANSIIMSGFIKVENSLMITDVERVNSVLLEKIQSMDAVTHDYATWDTSYYAVTGENTQYNDVDLAGSLVNTKLDFVIVMRNDGKILFVRDIFAGEEKIYNATTADLQTKEFYTYFEKNYALIICRNNLSNIHGFILLSNGLAMIASRPILMSDGTGAVQASIIFGQLMDESFTEKLSTQTRSSLSFQLYDSISSGDKLKLNMLFSSNNSIDDTMVKGNDVITKESDDSNISIQILNIDATKISGNLLLKNTEGKPVVLLKVVAPRMVYLEGKRAVKYTLQTIAIMVLLFIILEFLLFNEFIISRLISMEHQMRDIRSKKISSSRITITGKDELSSFGESVNDALDIIEKAIEEKQAVFDADPDTYFYVDLSWHIIDYKITDVLQGVVSEKNLAKLKTLSLDDLFNSTIMSKLFKARSESIKNLKPVILDFNISVNGSSRVFEARIVTVNNKNRMSLILLRDITDRKSFEQSLLEKNKDLENFNKFAIDREIRMSNLKKEIHDLKNKEER